MKPRIKVGDMYFHVLGGSLRGWYCEDESAREWGITPELSYRRWRMQSLYKAGVIRIVDPNAGSQEAARSKPWWHEIAGVFR